MELTLYVPGLLLPDAVRDDILFDLEAPALSLILGRGQHRSGETGWLAASFSAPSPLPVAALRRAAENSAETWLCLDPVHWQVTRDGIVLDDPDRLKLDGEESAALLAAIRPLFADWGELSASSPACWELRLTRSLMLDTLPLSESVGQPVNPGFPDGLDGPAWRQLIAEVQTVLHAHPVNRQRETEGKPPINSLWPWGAGGRPTDLHTDFTVGWGSDPAFAGLCLGAGIPCLAPPDRYQSASGNVLCHFDKLTHPARTLNAMTWRLALLELERDWLAPALVAMKQGACNTIRLVGTHLGSPHATATFSLVRGNLWRFWKRPQPLTALAAPA